MKTVSYLIVAYRSRATVVSLLDSIGTQIGDFQREIVVVDNSPNENCADLVQNRSVKYLLNQSNTGYTHGMNQALASSTGEFLFLLNPDIKLHANCTSELLTALVSDDTAAAPQLLHTDGTIQHSVRNFPNFSTLVYDATGLAKFFPNSRIFGRWRNHYFDHNTVSCVEQPMASALLIKRDVIRRLGAMDEQFFVFFSDVDYCKRMSDAGLNILFVPTAEAHHTLGASTKQEGIWLIKDSHRGFYRYLVKHELRGAKIVLRPIAAALLGVGAIARIAYRKLTGGSF